MTQAPPFIVFGLPRSRTFWLSRFLSYAGWTCGHDEARHVRGLADVRSWLGQERTGTVETAAAPFWRLVTALRPDIRIAVVRRPVGEVLDSLSRRGFQFDREAVSLALLRRDRKLDQIARRLPNVLSVAFHDLGEERACAGMFEHCLPFRHDPAWWRLVAPINLQVNLEAELRYERAHQAQITLAASLCAQEMRQLLWRGRPPADLDGMTIAPEPFESFWRDGQALFAQHCADVGEPSDEFFHKNLPLIRRLDQLGALQIVTARCNGRMFGYLATIIGPSLEDPGLKVATQTTFYASHDARGLGLRLQRASIAALAARGERMDVIQRAGVRGSGPKMGALYRRMGAEEYGQLFKLTVKAA